MSGGIYAAQIAERSEPCSVPNTSSCGLRPQSHYSWQAWHTGSGCGLAPPLGRDGCGAVTVAAQRCARAAPASIRDPRDHDSCPLLRRSGPGLRRSGRAAAGCIATTGWRTWRGATCTAPTVWSQRCRSCAKATPCGLGRRATLPIGSQRSRRAARWCLAGMPWSSRRTAGRSCWSRLTSRPRGWSSGRGTTTRRRLPTSWFGGWSPSRCTSWWSARCCWASSSAPRRRSHST